MKSMTEIFELSNVGCGNLKEGYHLKDIGADWRIMLKQKLFLNTWTTFKTVYREMHTAA
jgi:hypothetical protein